jgi:hypothetical protein
LALLTVSVGTAVGRGNVVGAGRCISYETIRRRGRKSWTAYARPLRRRNIFIPTRFDFHRRPKTLALARLLIGTYVLSMSPLICHRCLEDHAPRCYRSAISEGACDLGHVFRTCTLLPRRIQACLLTLASASTSWNRQSGFFDRDRISGPSHRRSAPCIR